MSTNLLFLKSVVNTTYIHITNAFKFFLVKSRSNCLFWLLTDWLICVELVMGRVGIRNSDFRVQLYFSQIFVIFKDFMSRSFKNNQIWQSKKKHISGGYLRTRHFGYLPDPPSLSGMVLDRSFDYNFHLNPPKLLCSVENQKPIIIKGFVPQPLTEWSNNLKNDPFSVI